jgi:hypothetical protein
MSSKRVVLKLTKRLAIDLEEVGFEPGERIEIRRLDEGDGKSKRFLFFGDSVGGEYSRGRFLPGSEATVWH